MRCCCLVTGPAASGRKSRTPGPSEQCLPALANIMMFKDGQRAGLPEFDYSAVTRAGWESVNLPLLPVAAT